MECSLILREVEIIINERYEFLLKNHKLSLSMQLTYSYPEIARDYAQWLMEVKDVMLEVEEKLSISPLYQAILSADREVRLALQELLETIILDGLCVQICRLLQLLGFGRIETWIQMAYDSTNAGRLIFTRLRDALS